MHTGKRILHIAAVVSAIECHTPAQQIGFQALQIELAFIQPSIAFHGIQFQVVVADASGFHAQRQIEVGR